MTQQPTARPEPTRARPANLIWVLTAIGLGAGVAVLGIVGFEVWTLRADQERLAGLNTRVIEVLEGINRNIARARVDIDGLLDSGRDTAPAAGGAWLGEVRQLAAEHAPALRDTAIEEPLVRLGSAVRSLGELRDEVATWRPKRAEARVAVGLAHEQVNRTLHQLRGVVASSEGRQRLLRLRKARRLESAPDGDLRALSEEMAGEMKRGTSLSTLNAELADLSGIVERLSLESNRDHLGDIKDNKLHPTLQRLRREARRSGGEGNAEQPVWLVSELEVGLLGAGFAIDDVDHTLRPGRGGLYRAAESCLDLALEEREFRARASSSFEELRVLYEALVRASNEEVELRAGEGVEGVSRAGLLIAGVALAVGAIFAALARQIASAVGVQVAAIRDANLALDGALSRAEVAARTKSEFLANMSHEIRTPMSAILGYTEMMEDPAIGDADRADYLGIVRRNGQHLLRIINDILDLSRIEAGRVEIERIDVSPVEVMTDLALLFHKKAQDKGLGFHVEYRGKIPERIQTDPTRLRQVLVNLVGNAIKFTETGAVRVVASVSVDAGSAESGRARFEVQDTGVGMNAEECSRIFEAFSQADASTTRRFGGTGLGLTISKAFAALLGGDLSVQSRPGEGSSFALTVAAGSLEGASWSEGPSQVDLAAPRASSESAAAPAPPTPADSLHGRILLAEDGIDNQRLFRMLLRRAGLDVTVADHGAEAFAYAEQAMGEDEPFDLVLTDMQMPVMDGYTLAAQLREAGYSGPIVALTAHAMTGDRERCIAAGCDDFVTKPIDRNALIAKIAELLPKEPVPAPGDPDG